MTFFDFLESLWCRVFFSDTTANVELCAQEWNTSQKNQLETIRWRFTGLSRFSRSVILIAFATE